MLSFYFHSVKSLLKLALSCSLGLLLALYAGLLVMLSLTEFCLNTASEVASLESAKGAVYAFVFFNLDLSHFLSLPPYMTGNLS